MYNKFNHELRISLMQLVILAVVTLLEVYYLPYLGGYMGTFLSTLAVKWISEQVVGTAPAEQQVTTNLGDTQLVPVNLGE